MVEIRRLTNDAATLAALTSIMVEVVDGGGSVHFMAPLDPADARAYWAGALAEADAGGRIIFGGYLDGVLAGTVTLWTDTPPNQPHRAEIWKMMTRPSARRRGLATALLAAAEAEAARLGRTVLNLDTAEGGEAERLYQSRDWRRVGTIPDYALQPHGGLVATVIYFKRIEPAPA